MCLIVFAYKTHPDYKLILAANRDEFYERPTSVAGWWEDQPDILGGRDLKAHGTWMAMNKNGRFAAVTNYRDLSNIRPDAKSRGDLPVEFLLNGADPEAYGKNVISTGKDYNGFNLLVLDEIMTHFSNYEGKVNTLQPGNYGLSNALLDTSWPKVERAKNKFDQQIKQEISTDLLIELMQDEQVAPDHELPQTGLELEMERAVSAMCIRTPSYGTCCSTAITIDYDGNVDFVEKSHPVGNRKEGIQSFSFKIES